MRVSVLMPAYNVENYISKSIESILNQTFKDFELIILNDGSTDNTVKVIESFSDPRINLYHNEKNLGLAVTRNKLFNLSKGEYLAILDSDDLAHPNRIEEQVNFLDKNKDIGLVGSWINIINKEGSYQHTIKLKRYFIPTVLLFENCFAQSTIMLRKTILPEQKYRLEFPPVEDYELWIRLSKEVKMYNIPKPLVDYRVHNTNITFLKKEVKEKGELLIIKEQFGILGIHNDLPQIELFHSLQSRLRFFKIKNVKVDIIFELFDSICSIKNNNIDKKTLKLLLGYRILLWSVYTRNIINYKVIFSKYLIWGLKHFILRHRLG